MLSIGLLLGLPLVPTTTAAAAAPTISGGVTVLGEKDFHQVIKGDDIWFIKFYAPWCHFCKKMAPMWHDLSTIQADVKIAKVDCTVHKSLCLSYNVDTYPSLKYIKKGIVHDYMGSKEKDPLVAFMHKIQGHYWTEISSESEIASLYPSGPHSGANNGVVFLLTLRLQRSSDASALVIGQSGMNAVGGSREEWGLTDEDTWAMQVSAH